MPYEVTCPSCHIRLQIKDETGEPWLICPRCLNRVPHPANPGESQAASPAFVRPGLPTGKPPVPTVESEVQGSTWRGYIIVVALLLLGMAGIFARLMLEPQHSGLHAIDIMAPLSCFGLLMVLLPFAILYPLIRAWSGAAARRSGSAATWSRGKNLLVIVGVLILSPIAAFILLWIVCTAMIVRG
jgi:hypothetical protein